MIWWNFFESLIHFFIIIFVLDDLTKLFEQKKNEVVYHRMSWQLWRCYEQTPKKQLTNIRKTACELNEKIFPDNIYPDALIDIKNSWILNTWFKTRDTSRLYFMWRKWKKDEICVQTHCLAIFYWRVFHYNFILINIYTHNTRA